MSDVYELGMNLVNFRMTGTGGAEVWIEGWVSCRLEEVNHQPLPFLCTGKVRAQSTIVLAKRVSAFLDGRHLKCLSTTNTKWATSGC